MRAWSGVGERRVGKAMGPGPVVPYAVGRPRRWKPPWGCRRKQVTSWELQVTSWELPSLRGQGGPHLDVGTAGMLLFSDYAFGAMGQIKQT